MTCFGVIQTWGLQLTSHVTLRALIHPICEMGRVMPVSKDHGGDSIAIKALKSINSPFLMCRDGFVLSSQRDSETNREGGE